MAQVGAASLRRVTRDRKTLSGRRGRRAIGGLPVCKYFSRCRVLTKLYYPSRGTEGSNPASSSGESIANLPHPAPARTGDLPVYRGQRLETVVQLEQRRLATGRNQSRTMRL